MALLRPEAADRPVGPSRGASVPQMTSTNTAASLIPFTSRVIKEFGPDRMVWSGDSPHIAEVHMKGYPAADIAKVKGGNLQKLLNWA